MIYEITGDILLSQAQAVAHGIAPNDHFNTGLALALREQWPAMYQDFRHYCHSHHPKPGTIWAWGGANGQRIVSLFTQEAAPNQHANPGHASVSHVNHALRALHQLVEEEKFTSLALPRLATGVGGLQWDDVFPLIKKHLGELAIPVFVYTTYHQDQRGAEKLS